MEKALNPVAIDSISQSISPVLSLLKKRLLHADVIQSVHGIPFSHVQVLSLLVDTGEMTISEISVRLGMSKSNITPLVDRLIANQYVCRVKDSRDKRVVRIVLLERGKEKLRAIEKTIYAQIMELADDITVSDFQDLADSLQNISRILSRLTE